MVSLLLLSFVVASVCGAGCPFGYDKKFGAQQRTLLARTLAQPTQDYVKAAQELDWTGVYNDLAQLLVTPHNDIWPIDDALNGNFSYAGFFIRQAWHCAGSYRQSDGLGGCAGGRQRFEPELSWPDNTNLDKAKKLLWPIKQKYGLGLSWGDLIILAGKVAIEQGGHPFIGFCAGRPDQDDGSQSDLLGPTQAQEKHHPCAQQGNCKYPFGATTIGLIYVNPEGFLGDYENLTTTAALINFTFGGMSMNAEETVALIGGGHAFGKTHGACMIDPNKFQSPKDNPLNPWPISICANGSFTTGFEGYWTPTPSKWSNGFFRALTSQSFSVVKAPGGNMQYQANPNSKFMMLPSDMSLLTDRLYTAYAKMFANDQSYLTDAFARAWYKLTTRDMGPIQRCLNVSINGVYQLPPAQPFQYNLPPPPTSQPDWAAVKMAIRSSLYTDPNLISGFAPDLVGGRAYWGAMFIHIAFQCAATYRSTDHLGGANGARCLLLPQDDWIFNAGTDAVVSVILSPLKSRFPTLTFSDLIVLAGTVALEDAANITLPFCPGRSDADPTNVYPKGVLVPGFNYSDVSLPLDWMARVRGLLPEELVAIYGRSRSYNQMQRMDYLPMTWQTGPIDVLGNEYFVALVSDTWISIGDSQYRNNAGTRGMTASDMQILFHPRFKNIAQNFAADEQLFKSYLASAWTKMMNSDRYDGPLGNVCQ